MTETDRIVAAIFTHGICGQKPMEAGDYYRVYDECLAIVAKREAAQKKKSRLHISEDTLAEVRKKSPRAR